MVLRVDGSCLGAARYHHGCESTDVALLHDQPPQLEKGTVHGLSTGTVHGLSTGTSCQHAQAQQMEPFTDCLDGETFWCDEDL